MPRAESSSQRGDRSPEPHARSAHLPICLPTRFFCWFSTFCSAFVMWAPFCTAMSRPCRRICRCDNLHRANSLTGLATSHAARACRQPHRNAAGSPMLRPPWLHGPSQLPIRTCLANFAETASPDLSMWPAAFMRLLCGHR